ncbi:Bacterial membrane flanked domain protein [Microbacterium sp. SA39]|nr:Bacterial membrane flanked domain protein [Microbacterium sp. SA39]
MRHMKRLPFTSVTAEWVRSLPSVVGMVAVYIVAAVQPLGPLTGWLQGLALALITVRVVAPIYQWATTRVAIGERGVSTVKGILGARRDAVAWRDIEVVEAHQPWSFRIWDLSIVRLRPAGDLESHVVLDGVDRRMLNTLRDEVRSPGEAEDSTSNTTRTPIAPDLGRHMYRANVRDLVVTCVVQGRILVVALGIACAGYDLLTKFSFADVAIEWTRDHVFLAGSLITVVVTAITVASIIVRFGGLTIRRRGDGLELQYGLLDRTSRAVSSDALVGVAIRRNIIEMIFDRVRVSLVTSDGAGGLGQNLVLPSIPRRAANEALSLLDPDLADFRVLGSKGAVAAPRAVSLLGLIAAAAIAVWYVAMSLTSTVWLSLAAVLAAVLVAICSARVLATHFEVTSVAVIAHRHLTTEFEEHLRAGGLHVLRVCRLRRLPIRLVRLTYFAGFVRHRAGLTASDAEGLEIASAMRTAVRAGDEVRRVPSHLTEGSE